MMQRRDRRELAAALIDRMLAQGYPHSVTVAAERGLPKNSAGEGFQLCDLPRLSICLSRVGRYRILREGALVPVTLRQGEAMVVSPGCLMGSHPEGRYLAFGLVFLPEMTRFLLAKRSPASVGGRHRFLFAHHSAALMDEELRGYCEIIEKAERRGAAPRYLSGLVQLVLQRAKELCLVGTSFSAASSAHFTWKAAREFVQEHLHLPLSRNAVAEFLRIHPNHVSRLFAQFADCSFSDYLRKARMAKATRLLRDASLRISEVAAACGMQDANYFSRCFRQEFGRSPRESRSASEGWTTR